MTPSQKNEKALSAFRTTQPPTVHGVPSNLGSILKRLIKKSVVNCAKEKYGVSCACVKCEANEAILLLNRQEAKHE